MIKCFERASQKLYRTKMDLLRQIVGGPKKRFKQFGYNLDLSYITHRVIAMAFPASGIQKLYRNSVDSIRQFFQNAHQNKYITINISGRSIEDEKLQNVSSYDWEDHKAPSFDILFRICDKVALFLNQDIDRVAVFHCNHGKGRTGTIICCFFLFLGLFKQPKQVMDFYAAQRFASQGYGVTQPCQILYINYFFKLLMEPNLFPKVYVLRSIQYKGQCQFSEPYIKVYRMSGKDLIYNSKHERDSFKSSNGGLMIKLKKGVPIVGDVVIQIKDHKAVGKNLLISYAFNTAFLGNSKQLDVSLKELSPLGRQKLDNFGSSFHISIHLDPLCDCGQKRNALGCNLCKGALKGQIEKWALIQSVLKKRESFVAKALDLAYGNKKP